MSPQTKICQSCGEVNPAEARECRSCGRYFIVAAGKPTASSPAEAIMQPAVIFAVVLFLSLFLPWFSVFMFSISAIQIISLSKEAGGFSIRAGGLFTLTQILFYLLPVGCVAVVVLAVREAGLRLVGTLTGSLPTAIFILMYLQSSQVLSFMGIGFVVAILAGVGLIVFSRRES
jgi:hypothetical protein